MRFYKKIIGTGLAFAIALSLAACGNDDGEDVSTQGGSQKEVPTIDQINVGEDYQDINAEIKVLTNRTDIVDTVYKGYAEEFMKVYPNIKVTYEGVICDSPVFLENWSVDIVFLIYIGNELFKNALVFLLWGCKKQTR